MKILTENKINFLEENKEKNKKEYQEKIKHLEVLPLKTFKNQEIQKRLKLKTCPVKTLRRWRKNTKTSSISKLRLGQKNRNSMKPIRRNYRLRWGLYLRNWPFRHNQSSSLSKIWKRKWKILSKTRKGLINRQKNTKLQSNQWLRTLWTCLRRKDKTWGKNSMKRSKDVRKYKMLSSSCSMSSKNKEPNGIFQFI